MDVGIRFEKPERTVQNAFENIYRYLTIEEFGNLRQTEIYGQYTTNEEAVEFILYKGEDNKIAIVFNIINTTEQNEKKSSSPFVDETKVICISGVEENYLDKYTHFMIISGFQHSIEILETGGEKLKPGKDFRYIKAGILVPSPKITTILQQGEETTRCTVEEKSRMGAITYKIKTWENSQKQHIEESKIKEQTADEKNFEEGKQLPKKFEEEIERCKVAEIIKQYFESEKQEQQCKTNRAGITMTRQ